MLQEFLKILNNLPMQEKLLLACCLVILVNPTLSIFAAFGVICGYSYQIVKQMTKPKG